MIRHPPDLTRPEAHLPYPTLFRSHSGQAATVPGNGPLPGGGTSVGGTASLPAGDWSWAEVMVEWHPVIATAASAAASRGSWIRRGRFIGSGILAPGL